MRHPGEKDQAKVGCQQVKLISKRLDDLEVKMRQMLDVVGYQTSRPTFGNDS